jgi:outer membrane immunogenic protein
MLKKISFITFLLACSAPAWSNGFYLGGGFGPEIASFNQSATVKQPGNFNVKDTTYLSGTGIFGSLFGGYAVVYSAFYLAGEVNANMSSVTFDSSNYEFLHSSTANTHYRMQYGFGLSILPGYIFTPATLFYGRLGYANGNFNISTNDTSLAKTKKNLSGLRFGVGINQSLSQQIAMRMEYSQVNYRSTSFSVVDGTTTKTTSIKPTTGQVEFGLVYKFG